MQKKSFINSIIKNFTILLIIFAIFLISLEVYISFKDFSDKSTIMREKFIKKTKNDLKYEVLSTVWLIRFTKKNIMVELRQKIKDRVNMVYGIVKNIYYRNKNLKSNEDILLLIKDSIAPITFNNGKEYFFITDLTGKAILFPINKNIEGKNILNVMDKNGKYVVKDLIKIAKTRSEGFYEYIWKKPFGEKKYYKKISYIKYFKPLNFYIGTSLYYDDIVKYLQEKILKEIAKIRFGKEGYIFVNKFDGTALVSNGKIISGNKKLWDTFGKNKERYKKVKKIFNLELNAAKKKNGGFINYTWEKLTNANKISPKVSFIYGIKDWQWIIGAGAYIDDIEQDISILKEQMISNLTKRVKLQVIIAILSLLVLLFIQLKFKKRFDKDYKNFQDLILNSLEKGETVNTEKIKYIEFFNITNFVNLAINKLKKSEQKFRGFFENALIPFSLINEEYKYFDTNNAALQMLNYKDKNTFLNNAYAGKLSPKYQPDGELSVKKAKKLVDEIFKTEKSISFEWVLKKFTGETFYALITLSILPFDDKKAILVTWADISEIKKLQKVIESERKELEITLKSIGDGVIKVNKENKIDLMNSMAEKLTGWKFEEAKGKSIFEIFKIYNSITKEKVKNPTKEVFETGKIVRLANHTILISKNNKILHIEDSAAPIKEKNGKIIGAILVFRDVTEKLQKEKELLKAERLQSLGILAGGIAHDFNNLLTSLYGYISLAKQFLTKNNKIYKYIDRAEKSIERTKDLTKQLLTFSKGGEPVLENVDIKILIKEVVKFNLRGSSIKPHFDINENIYNIEADKGQFSQVISNLTINAVQAMDQGGNIYVTADNCENPMPDLHGKYVKIIFEDDGKGISSEILDKIFDPYFTTKDSGSGLGLSTVYSIITKHKGKILVESEIGKGTIFTIYLPALENVEKIAAQKSNSNETSLKEYQGFKILVMDDESYIRELVKDMLEVLGHTFYTATDGDEAIKKYKNAMEKGEKFDLVILDLTIQGGKGGKETIQQLREIDPNINAIVASGYSDDIIMTNYKEFGFKGRLVKPYLIDNLKEEIFKVMKQENQ